MASLVVQLLGRLKVTALLIHCIVCQVDEHVAQLGLASIRVDRLVLLCRESHHPLVVQVYFERVAA